MLENIRESLVEISQAFKDTRVNYFKLEVVSVADSNCTLSGAVLDEDTLTAVTTQLKEKYSAIQFDTQSVTILRKPQPTYLTVSTNLAGVHRYPSRMQERVSEVLNGRVIESLIEEEYWVFARQMDGYLGWIRRQYLTESPPPEPTHIVLSLSSPLYDVPEDGANLVSRIMSGTLVAVNAISDGWAQIVLAGEWDGWISLADLRALAEIPEDENRRRQQMVADAMPFIGVQYLWGGCTGQGIDCSGLVQTVYRMSGKTLLRDADMQFDAGEPIEGPFKPGDLFYFGSDKGHRSISHVGMSLGGWEMIHSSGPRNGVYIDDVQKVSWLRDSFLGARSFLKD
jgi:SH3-like domain-containing protein